MKVQNMELNEIRREYSKTDNNFIIRIRDNDKENDIVYYNGIKAFEIEKEGKEYNIKIADNIFNLNKTNIEKFYKDEDKQGLTVEALKEAISEARITLRDYFPKELEKITIKISANGFASLSEENETKKEFINSVKKRIAKIQENYGKYLKEKLSYEKIMAGMTKKKTKNSEYFVYEIQLNDIKKTNSEEHIKTMVNLEYDFITCFIFDENMKYKRIFTKPEFSYQEDENNVTVIQRKKYNNNFKTFIKKVIGDYEIQTKTEKEKRYQHLFMTSNILANKYADFENIYRFEEEYYTDRGGESSDRGRIDCVFVKINENINENKPNAELYLIELKVDNKVIGSSNGVNKHLIDIKNLENNQNFISDLEKNINDRRRILEEGTEIKIDKNKIHFWTIIAISTEDEVEGVAEMLYTNLENPEYIKNEKNKLPKNSVVLSEEIRKVKASGIKDVKFLFDKWEYHIDANKLSNKYLFEATTRDELMNKWKQKK